MSVVINRPQPARRAGLTVCCHLDRYRRLMRRLGLDYLPALFFIYDRQRSTVLGEFRRSKRSIEVNVCGLKRELRENRALSLDSLRREIIKTLIHESRHAAQPLGYRLVTFGQWCLMVALAVTVFLTLAIVPIIVGGAAGFIRAPFSPAVAIVIVLSGAGMWVAEKFIGRLTKWYYRLSLTEIDARRFTAKHLSNPAWHRVIDLKIHRSDDEAEPLRVEFVEAAQVQ